MERMKVPVVMDDKMAEAYNRIWVGGMIVIKRFEDYRTLVEDLDKIGYDTSEYHRIIKTIKRGMNGKF